MQVRTMDKISPNKRKSLANTNTIPTKVQKNAGTPVSQKKNKSPKLANQKTPQKKQFNNGKQNTPKEKKKPKQTEEDETELMNEADETETDDSSEQAEDEELNGNSYNSVADESNDDESDEDDESNKDDESDGDETNNDKPVKKEVKSSAKDKKFGVYVAGLDYKFEESDIRKIFKNTNILSIVLLRNPVTNKSKGSGFVNFKDEASVKKALLKNGTEVHGRKLTVNLPMDKETHKTLRLINLKARVQKLEEELSRTGKKNILVNPTNNADKKYKIVKINEKKNANKKAIKQE